MIKNRILILHGFVVVVVIGVLFWQNYEFKNRLVTERNDSNERLEQVRQGMRERMEREVEDTIIDVRTKTSLDLYNSYSVFEPDKEKALYVPVKYGCGEKSVLAKDRMLTLMDSLQIDGALVDWCSSEGKSILFVRRDEVDLSVYLIGTGDNPGKISETFVLSGGDLLSNMSLQVLDWKRFNYQFESKDRITFQIVEYKETTPVEAYWENIVGRSSVYAYVLQGSNPGTLVEVCYQNDCSHVIHVVGSFIRK